MARIDLIGQSATSRSLNFNNMRLLNAYAEIDQSRGGKALAAIFGSPGLLRFCTLPALAGRGGFTASNGRCFCVQGAGLFELFVDGTYRLLGSLLTSSGPVCMDDNGIQLVVVDGPYGYVLTMASNAFGQITDPNFFGATSVAFLDGYFLFNHPDTGQFYFTPLYATSPLDALDFAVAEARADPLKALLVHREELWLGGVTTIEVFVNTGDLDTPFQRLPGAVIPIGLAASASFVEEVTGVYWLGADQHGAGIVYRAEGLLPVRISTHAVEHAVQSYSTVSDAVGWMEQREGHPWYVLTFPTANATWVYDLATQLWHERGYMTPATAAIGRHRAAWHTYAFGKHLVGDYADGRVYEQSLTTNSDDGDALPCEFIPPPLFDPDTLNRMVHAHLVLDMETGIGLDGGVSPGSDPQILMQQSDDGGHTWGSERARSMGKLGEYKTRVHWWRNGLARDRRYRFTVTDPVKRAFLALYIETGATAA